MLHAVGDMVVVAVVAIGVVWRGWYSVGAREVVDGIEALLDEDFDSILQEETVSAGNGGKNNARKAKESRGRQRTF